MIEFLLIRIGFSIGFADAFRHDFQVTFLVACVFTIFALHTGRVLQEIATQSAAHDIIKLLENEFVAVEFMNFLFSLTDGALAIQPEIERSLVLVVFCCQILVIHV